jgi:hypothetical protein
MKKRLLSVLLLAIAVSGVVVCISLLRPSREEYRLGWMTGIRSASKAQDYHSVIRFNMRGHEPGDYRSSTGIKEPPFWNQEIIVFYDRPITEDVKVCVWRGDSQIAVVGFVRDRVVFAAYMTRPKDDGKRSWWEGLNSILGL